VLELIKHHFDNEESIYPRRKGFTGCGMLINELLKLFTNYDSFFDMARYDFEQQNPISKADNPKTNLMFDKQDKNSGEEQPVYKWM